MSRVLPRMELLRRGRIAILDDELPEMLQDLRDQGLSIDHLSSTEDPKFPRLKDAFYDLLLLDYGGIGPQFGQDEGLDVLRYLQRVNPSLRILAFTARTFDSSKADFFRLCAAVVKKDAGIRETLEQLEFHLSEVLTPAHQLHSLANALELSSDQSRELEGIIVRAIQGTDTQEKAVAAARRFAKGGGQQLLEALVKKAIDLGVTVITASG